MSRYIDADALKDDILKSAVMIDDRGIQTGYEIAIELIKRQPTIEAVSVIRCKDCKYRDEETANCTRFRKDWYVQSNSFCSWAEPKESK